MAKGIEENGGVIELENEDWIFCRFEGENVESDRFIEFMKKFKDLLWEYKIDSAEVETKPNYMARHLKGK